MFTLVRKDLLSKLSDSEITKIIEGISDPFQQQNLTENEDGAQDIQPDDAVGYVPPPPVHLRFTVLHRDMPITRKELDIIKLTSQFEAVYGFYFRVELMKTVFTKPEFDPHFQFMKSTSNKHYFYAGISHGYSKVLLHSQMLKKKCTRTATVIVGGFLNLLRQVLEKEDEQGVEMAMNDLHAFEYFVNMEYINWPTSSGNLSKMMHASPKMQPSQDIQHVAPATDDAEQNLQPPPPQEPLSFPSLPEGIPITRKELDIIKITAQFVAVFGTFFEQDLMETVIMRAHLHFMWPTDSRHDFYSQLVLGYERVLLCCKKLRKNGASTESVLEGYFNIVRSQVLERTVEMEEGPEMAMVELHAFEYFIEVEYTDWRRLPMPGYLKQQPQMQPPLGSQLAHTQVSRPPSMGMMQSAPHMPGMSPPPPRPLPAEPEPKKQKVYESSLVPEDQFLSQHPKKRVVAARGSKVRKNT